MLSRSLEKTLRRALALANARQHEYATLEHLLMALTDDDDAAAVLRACAVEIDRLRSSLTDFPRSRAHQPRGGRRGRRQADRRLSSA